MEINQIKENIRFIEDETDSIRRDIEQVKRMSPIEEAKILPIGTFLLFLGSLFALGAYWSLFHHFGGIIFCLNVILAIILFYFGAKITRLGWKFKRMTKRTQIILTKAEKYKEELEKLIAEKQ